MDVKVFGWIGDALQDATTVMITNSVSTAVDSLKLIILGVVTLYLIYKGYQVLFSRCDDPILDIIGHCAMVVFVTHFALSVDGYTANVLDFIHGVEIWLSSLFVPDTTNTGRTTFDLLDNVLGTALNQIQYCAEKIQWSPSTWGWIAAGIAIFIGYVPLIVQAAIIIIGAKFLLTVMCCVGPLFITFSLFPATKQFFDRWVSKTFEQCLTMALGLLVTTLMMSIFDQYLVSTDITKEGVNPLVTALLILPISWILRYVIEQIPNMSGSLSGGFASAVMTAKHVTNGAREDSSRSNKMLELITNPIKTAYGAFKKQPPSANSISKGTQNPAQQIVRDNISKHNK
ncbi:type IV secretion system protein [Photobacterium damselae]|uniref:type IV secretion system protein n=1 Tax=Photobacterium damselae TaxID=38293 RepID=UPI001EFD7CFA|nr:type IV secretion system protein [Photobacterium damselae]MCG9706469.1 type IV secretion system protein [Photobacterium damselae]